MGMGQTALDGRRGLVSRQVATDRLAARLALAGWLALAATGCGEARSLQARQWAECVACHGGTDDQTGAPPRSLSGATDPAVPGVGAHTAHVTAGSLAGAFGCGECHPDPRTSPGSHMNSRVDLAFGPLATAGGTTPAYSAADHGCRSTYCHGAFPGGNAFNAPEWTRSGQGQAACGTCHGVPPAAPHMVVATSAAACSGCHPQTVGADGAILPGGAHVNGRSDFLQPHGPGWKDPSSAGFHAFSANGGVSACLGCHSAAGCTQCHRAGGAANDFASCTSCHGGTDNATGAPPRTRWPGETSTTARGVGAHSSHVTGRLGGAGMALSAPFDCTACHVEPGSWTDAGHVDGSVAVTGYTGGDPALAAAVKDPGWSPASATCATAYCHGATLLGGSLTTPAWTTVDGSQAACGTCHGLPPSSGFDIGGRTAHDFHVSLQVVPCSRCHVGYTQATVDPALHVNGVRDVVFQYALPDPSNPDLVAACNAPITLTARISGWDCTGCHAYKDAWSQACCGVVICY